MSTLSERILVEVPAAQSQARLAGYFQALDGRRSGTARLSLTLPVRFSRLAIPLALQRAVVATLAPFRFPGEIAARREVRWAPLRPGPCPTFHGELSVEPAEGGAAFWLLLNGSYTPPAGALGEPFDPLAGSNIARATAFNLLERIKIAIEDTARSPGPSTEPLASAG